MTGAIGRALCVVATLLLVAIFLPTYSFAVTSAANAQCKSGDYTCDYPGTRTVGTGQYATKVQCMRNSPCRDTTAQTTTNGKCVAFETCSVSKETDKDITGKPSGWQGEGDSTPTAPQIPSVPTPQAPATPAPTTPSTQPPNANPTDAFKEPQKTADPAKQVENKSLVERLRSFFTGTPTGETTPDPNAPGTMTGFPGGETETLQPNMNNDYGYGNTPEDNFGYGNPYQDGNTTFGPQVNPTPSDERTTFERVTDFVTSPFKSTPDNYGYGNPNQTEPYNYPTPEDPRLPAHFDPQDPLFNSVGPAPTKTELTWLNDKTAADIRLAEKQVDLAKMEADFKPLSDRATQLANEMDRLAAGAQKTDKSLVFKTKDELNAYNAARTELQKMQPELQAASSRYGQAIADYNTSVQAYNKEFFSATYDAMGTAYYGPGAAETAMLADRMGDYRASGGKFYDAFGGEYTTPSQAVQADRFLLKNAEIGNQYFAQEKVIEQFKGNNSWFTRTFGSETRQELLREEGRLSQLKDAMKTNTAVANYLGKGPDAALFAERLNVNPTTPQELAVRSLLYGQARDWDQNYSMAETIRTGSTEDLLRMGYIPPEGQDITRDDILKHYQFRSDLSAGRIAELTGAKEMTPQTLWSIATLTKSPEDFAAFNRAYLAGSDTPLLASILGEDRYHKLAGEVYAFGQTSIDSFVTKAFKDASERLTLTTPSQWAPGIASLLAGSIVGNVGEFVGLPTTQRSIEMLSQTPGEIAFSRGISGPMALLDLTTLSAPKLAFTGTSLALREASLAAGEFRFGAGLTEGLSATEARVAARYAETVESNISGQVARGEMSAAAAQRAAYSELYEQIARSDAGRTGQVDNLMASLRTRMEALDITPPGGYRPQGATAADTVTDVARAPEPVVTPAPGSPSNVTNIPRAEAPITNPTTVSPVTNTVRDAAVPLAREAAVAEALAEKAVIAQQAGAARTYEEAFAARAKADEIQTKLNTQIARELETMAAQNVVRETDALRQLRQATVEIQNLQTDLAKTMAREAISSPPNISRSPYNEVVLSNRFGPLGRAQALVANVFAETALSVRNAFATPAQSLRTTFAAFQIQVGGIEAGNAGSNALESLVRAGVDRNVVTLTPNTAAPVTNPSQAVTSPVLSRIPDAMAPVVNTAIPLSRFDATDILGNVNPFAQPTVIQNARGVGLTSEIPAGQQSFITYEGGKVVFNVRSVGEAVPSGTSYSIDLANLRVSATRIAPETFVPNSAPAQVTPGTAVTAPAPTQAAPVTTARYGVPNFFSNGILNAPGEAAKFVWNSINPISSARAATPPVAGEVAVPTAPVGNPVTARTTFYGPGAGGTMQGGWETSRPNLEGIRNERGAPIPRTLDDVRLGKAGYVSLAVDPSNYGKFYNMGPVTYRSVLDKKIYTGDKLAAEASLKKADPNLHMTYSPQLEKVIGYAHDTGGAFMGRPDKFDIAVGDFRGWSAGDSMRFLTSSGQEYGGNKLNAWQQVNAVQARQYIAAVTAKPPSAVAEMTPKPAVTKPVVETVRAANTASMPIVKRFTERLTQRAQSISAAIIPRSIAPSPTAAVAPQPVEMRIKNSKGEDLRITADATGGLQVNGRSYRELADVETINAVDKQIIQPRLVSELEKMGHKVVIVPEPTGLPRSPFYIQKAAGELPIAPATNIVSHVALGDNAQTVIQGGLQPRFGQYLNASIYTENCATGKCTVYIRDGLPRANHTARTDGRMPNAPDVYNWNSHGIELVARSETSVTAAGAQSVSDISVAYRNAIGSDVRVVAHSDLNARDDSVAGLKNVEGQKGKAQAIADLQNTPRVAQQAPQQSPQTLTSAPRRLAEGGNKEFEAYTDLSVVVGRETLMRQGYIFVPANIDASKPVTIVLYMHGHLEGGQSINAFSNTVQRQQLAQQIRNSGMNAVLVAPNMDAIPAASGYFARPGETTKFLTAAEYQFAQTIGMPREAMQNAPVVLVTYSGGYYPAGKMLASGELNQRLSAILMLDSGYGTEADGFLQGVKNWSQANPSGIVVSGYTVSTKPGNDALTNLFRNERTKQLTRTITTSPLPADEVIKPGTFAQIRAAGTPATPHRNFVSDAGLTTAGVQAPIESILKILPPKADIAVAAATPAKVPQVVRSVADRSIFAQAKSPAVQSNVGSVSAPTEAWMGARATEIVNAMGGSNGVLRPYTYDAAGVVRDLATGKVLEGFSFKPSGSAAARLDQLAKINGKTTNYKYNVVDGRLVALNELVRRSLGLQELPFMSGVRPLDIGSNRHHTIVKGPDGTNMLITYAIDYAGGNTTIKAAIAAAASRAQTSLNAATGGKPFVPLSIGAQYPNTPNMVHMDVNPRPEARTWGGGQTNPLLSSIISFVARGSNTAENPVTHAVFAEALKQARLGISPTNPMVAIGTPAPGTQQIAAAPALPPEAPDASLPTQTVLDRFTARIASAPERITQPIVTAVKDVLKGTATAPEPAPVVPQPAPVVSEPAPAATVVVTPPVAQPAPAVAQTVPATVPQISLQQRFANALSRIGDGTQGWLQRSGQEFTRLAQELRTPGAPREVSKTAPNTIIGSDGDVIVLPRAAENPHEMVNPNPFKSTFTSEVAKPATLPASPASVEDVAIAQQKRLKEVAETMLKAMYNTETLSAMPARTYREPFLERFYRTQLEIANETITRMEIAKTRTELGRLSVGTQEYTSLSNKLANQERALTALRDVNTPAYTEFLSKYAKTQGFTSSSLTAEIRRGEEALVQRLGADWRAQDVRTVDPLVRQSIELQQRNQVLAEMARGGKIALAESPVIAQSTGEGNIIRDLRTRVASYVSRITSAPTPNLAAKDLETIIGSDGDVIVVQKGVLNTHEMPTGVSAATPAAPQPVPRAAADVASGVRDELTQTQRALQEAARTKAAIADKKPSEISKIPTEPKVVKLPTAKVTEVVQKAVTREAPVPAYYPNPEALNAVTRLMAANQELSKATVNLAQAFQRMRAGNTDVNPVSNAMSQLSQARRNVQIAFNDAVRAKAFSSSDIGSIRDRIVAVNRIGNEIEGYRTYSSYLSPDLVNTYWDKIAVINQTGTAAIKNLIAKVNSAEIVASKLLGTRVVEPSTPVPPSASPSAAVPASAVSPAPTAPAAAATDGSGFSLSKLISNIRENDVARPFFDTGVVLGTASIALKATDITAKVLKKATTAVANTWKAAFSRTTTAPATPAAPAAPARPATPAAPTAPTPSSPTPRAALPSLGAVRSAASRASAALAPVARAAGVRAVAGTSAATKTVRNWVSARLARGTTTGTFAATPANPILRINPTSGKFEFIPPTTSGAAPTASLPGRFIQGTWSAAKWCVSGFGKFAACALGGGIGYSILDAVQYSLSGEPPASTVTVVPPAKNPNAPANPGTQPPGTQAPGTPGTPGTTPGGETADSGLGGLGGLGSLGNIAKALPQLMQNLKNLFNPQQNTQPTTPANIPIVKLDANPISVVSGTTTRLSWSGETIANCTVIGPGSTTLTRGGASGVITSPALATSTEFAVICSGTDGVSATNSTVTVSVDGSTAPTIPVILPPGVTKNASYSTAFNNPAGTSGSGTGAGTGSGNSTSGTGNNEAPVTPKTSGVDQYGNKVSAWCDPNQPIDSYTTCLCNLEPTGCYPWRTRQQ